MNDELAKLITSCYVNKVTYTTAELATIWTGATSCIFLICVTVLIICHWQR